MKLFADVRLVFVVGTCSTVCFVYVPMFVNLEKPQKCISCVINVIVYYK
jgi:hypothetical protein